MFFFFFFFFLGVAKMYQWQLNLFLLQSKQSQNILRWLNNTLFDYFSTSCSHSFGLSGHVSGHAAQVMVLVGSLIKNPQHSDND